MFFKIKPGILGADHRYKARLVVKGYSKLFGIDFDETFPLVAKQDTLKILKKTIKVAFKEENLVRHALNAVVPTGRRLRSKFPDSARIRFQLIELP